MNNQYGYYELEFYQTKEGIAEQEHIDYICNQWKKENDENRRVMRIRKIKNILK